LEGEYNQVFNPGIIRPLHAAVAMASHLCIQLEANQAFTAFMTWNITNIYCSHNCDDEFTQWWCLDKIL